MNGYFAVEWNKTLGARNDGLEIPHIQMMNGFVWGVWHASHRANTPFTR
jgi:hypothetical protein